MPRVLPVAASGRHDWQRRLAEFCRGGVGRLGGQRAAQTARRDGANRGRVLARGSRHVFGRRSGRGARRAQFDHRGNRGDVGPAQHQARADQLRHDLCRTAQPPAPHDSADRRGLSLWVCARRAGSRGAYSRGSLRGRRAARRSPSLFRPAAFRQRRREAANLDLSKSLLLRGGRVVTMDASRRILNADVLIEDGRIKRIGRLDGRTVGRSKPITIDCSGLVVLPGLVQAHIHLCQTLFRGLADDLSLEEWLAKRIWPLEAAHTEASVYASAMLGAAELLLGGTTAILDMETVRHTEAAFEALESIGIRATAGKCLMDAPPPANPPALRESTDQAITESADLCARWHGAARGRLRYCFAPRFAPSCTGPLLRAVSDLAERTGATIHTHAAETPLELDTVKRETGHNEIAYLDSIGISGPRAALAHCVWVEKDDIAALARQQTNVVHCPSSNLKLGSGIAPIPAMLAAGCRVGIGADGAPCNNRLDAFTEMRLAALIQKPRLGPDALPAAQALELATLGGARALGLGAEIGSIEVGKCADLIVLDLESPHAQPEDADLISRIVYSARAADVRHVIVDGRIVVRDGELKTADTAEIRRKANAEARALRAKALDRH